MQKIKLLLLILLLTAGQLLGQQSQSFVEHWFGINPLELEQKPNRATLSHEPTKIKNKTTKAIVTAGKVITLDLGQSTNPETFTIGDNGVWSETYNDIDYPFLEFNNSVFMFSHLVGGEGSSFGGSYWDGFTYSKNGINTDLSLNGGSWIGQEWGNMAGGGIQTDAQGNIMQDKNGVVLTDRNAPYLVGYWSGFMDGQYDYRLLTTAFDTLYHAKGIYVNNSPWPYYGNINGDGFARALNQDGDYFKLIIHGLDAQYQDNGKTVEHYLARNVAGQLIQSPHWQWVDLSALGEIGGIYFTLTSTDSDPTWGMNTAAYFCIDKLQVEKQVPVEYNYTITAPEAASVYVGYKGGKHYVPFTEKPPLATSSSEGKTTYYYHLKGQHNYRVSQEGKLTQAGLFTPSSTSTALEITADMLSLHSPQEIDHDVNHNNGYNVADLFLNINSQGHLLLEQGKSHQLVTLRTWQLTNSTVGNYFIEPDFHYTVVNENGEIDNSVVSVNAQGLVTAQGDGTAIVLVRYDAIHFPQAVGGPFWGALWAENTGVFVVSVGASDPKIDPNMKINATRNTTADSKLSGTSVDAELDVFYYAAETQGYDYRFSPNGVTSVSLAQPTIVENTLLFTGFTTDNVTAHGDGSYTVRLINGRNIVKLSSSTGDLYQVLTAKPVTYTVSNLTHPGENILPGDQVSLLFNTLYHPANKLSAVYNMTAGIVYSDQEGDLPLILGPGQYTFASKAQEIKLTIPSSYTEQNYVLANGAIKVKGYGSPYGDHRRITLENGQAPNMNAQAKEAYFGILPDISIRLKEDSSVSVETPSMEKISIYPNPFTDYITVGGTGTAIIYNLSGTALITSNLTLNNTIDTSALPQGVYLLKVGQNAVKIVK